MRNHAAFPHFAISNGYNAERERARASETSLKRPPRMLPQDLQQDEEARLEALERLHVLDRPKSRTSMISH